MKTAFSKMVVAPPGPKAQEIIQKEKNYIPRSACSSTPLVWKEAYGATIIDVDGNEYIDFTSGILVSNVGHSHPKVVAAIQEQAGKFLNSYDSSHHLRAELAEKIVNLFPEELNRVLLLTTGSEAIEAAIKFARAKTGKSEIISFHGSFHGRTHLTMSLGGIKKVKSGCGPQASNILHVPFPYPYRCTFSQPHDQCDEHTLQYMEQILHTASTGNIAAVIMESYLGSGGCVVPSVKFVQGVREFCDRHDILLIMDEVQAGFGRTGKMFGFEHYGILPDLVCLAKGISSGVPTSAVVGRDSIMDHLPPGTMTSTYGGNPLSCAAAMATIDVIVEERLPERAARLGERMAQRFQTLVEKYRIIGEARSIGLVSGIEVVKSREGREPDPETARAIAMQAIHLGLAVIAPTGLHGNVLRLMPPLVIEEEALEAGLDLLDEAISIVLNGGLHDH
ncbi:aspartate aminotransferase family protein [Ammoniphilus sp. CFH 90114]|uniref:aspartate aminotransferase family protein n=1 Tax=Ammoniphilus sp. CFH 90114 TaxID=2493665 RepID=UPI0013E967B2|nr:aspartate aminotransferase family protein [Ammoniphilus sp. CFH 90114]